MTEPVAGRQAESAELTALLDGVVAGRASALLLSGEAGIGKTSLVRHACSTWTGGTLIWAGCLPLRSLATPLLPLRSAFRSAASAPDFDAADRITAFDSWVDKAGPLVLVVDDLQWADPSTLDILMYVLAGPADRPVGVMLTLRTDDEPAEVRGWLADVRRLPRMAELGLGRLDRAATRDQIAGLLGVPPKESLVDAAQARSHGNPYLTRLLVRGLPPNAGDLPAGLPTELRDALARAWRGLSPPARELTSILAVTGHPRGDWKPVDLPQLREAVDASLLRVGAGDRYWFAHPLMAEVLVEEMLPEQRRALHADLARHLTPAGSRPEGMSVAEIVNLADHYHRAGLASPAFRWACHGADAVGSGPEALRLLRRAIELLPSVDEAGVSRTGLLQRMSRAAEESGLQHEELGAIDELLAELDAGRTPLLVAELMVRRAELRTVTGHVGNRAIVGEAVRISAVDPTSWQHAYAVARWAAFMERGDPGTQPAVARALTLARASGSDRALAVALAADVDLNPPAYDGSSTRQALEAQALAGKARDFWNFVDATFAAESASVGVSFREHNEICRRAHEELTALNAPHTYVSFMVACDAAGCFMEGDWPQAERLLRIALGKRPGHLAEIRVRLTASHLAMRRGRYAEAEAHLARTDELIAADSALPFMSIDRVRTELAVARGDFETGVAHAVDALDRSALGGPLAPHNIEAVIPLAVRAFASMAETARDRGDDPAPVLDRLRAFRREYPAVVGEYWVTGDKEGWYDASLRMHRAVLAAEESRAVQAHGEEIRWQEAAAACRAAERRWEEAYCRWREAEAWSRHRSARNQTATALLAAHRQASALGAQPLVDSLEALAGSARIPLTQAAVPDTAGVPALPGLTHREREILAHVVAGRSYTEIARELVLSEKTIAVHVSNMLRKTGTANRVELAQLARRLQVNAEPGPEAGVRSSGAGGRRR